MQQVFEKSVFDWSRTQSRRIQARGIAAILAQKAKVIAQKKASESSRCVWPSVFETRNSRYLSRRMGIN